MVPDLVEPAEPTRPFAPRRRALVMLVPHVVVFALGAVYIAPIIMGHQLLGVQAFPSTRLLDGVNGSQTASWLFAALMLDGEIVGRWGRWTALTGLFVALQPQSMIRDVRWAFAGGSWGLRTLGMLLAPLHAFSGLLSILYPAVRIVLGGLMVSVVGVTLRQGAIQ